MNHRWSNRPAGTACVELLGRSQRTMKTNPHPMKTQRAFALIELPLVLLILAVIGILAGVCLGYLSGRMTLGVWVAICLALPLGAFVALLALAEWKHRRGRKDDSALRQAQGRARTRHRT